MMQKNLIFSFSYFATVGKYTENPYGRKRQERDSDLYDISAERKSERQQNVFFNRCQLLISRGVNSATRIMKTVQTGKVSIKYSQKWSQRGLQTSLYTKIRFFFTKHRENLQAYKKSNCPKRTENFVWRLRLQESVVFIVFVSLQQSSVLDVIIF